MPYSFANTLTLASSHGLSPWSPHLPHSPGSVPLVNVPRVPSSPNILCSKESALFLLFLSPHVVPLENLSTPEDNRIPHPVNLMFLFPA